MEERKVDLTKYPEGLQYLAKELNLPIPPGSDRAARGVCDEPHLDAGAPVTPKHSYTL